MYPLIKATLAPCLALGLLMPACAQPPQHIRARASHLLYSPYRQTGIVVRRTPPANRRGPIVIGGPASNGITTRKVFLWPQPAKIEPHIREVPSSRAVRVVGSQGGFYAVVMHDGRQGWMPVDAVRPR